MTAHSDACHLCAQISGDSRNDLISAALRETRYVRRVPAENEFLALVPSVGPISRGHSLVCPKRHVKSFSALSDAEVDALTDFMVKAHQMLELVSKAPIHSFEHGGARCGNKTVCTVDHAHLHLLPTQAEVLPILLAEHSWIEIGASHAELVRTVGENEYLYYRTPEMRTFVLSAVGLQIESQYLRRIFASAVGLGRDWNWRHCLAIEEVDATYQAMASLASASP